MKSTSVLGESFSIFGSLFRERWWVYAWYLLSRVLEVLLLGAVIGLSFVAGFFDIIGQGNFVLPMLLFAGALVGAFFLESWFTFSLYRSLDQKIKDRSFFTFLKRGAENYWPRLGKLVLYSVIMAVFFMGSSLLDLLSSGTLQELLALLYGVLVIYLGVYLSMTYFEIIVADKWPWMTFRQMLNKIRGRMWWRILGSFIVWGILTLLVFALLGFLVAVGLFAGIASTFQSLSSLQIDTPQEVMQAASQFFSSGIIGSVVVSILLFVAASIVPVYGFFSVFLSAKKLAKF